VPHAWKAFKACPIDELYWLSANNVCRMPSAVCDVHLFPTVSSFGMRPLVAHCYRGLGMLDSQLGRVEQAQAELS
jgi:hypothetical protein